jgi:hypothetical protein
MEAVALSAGRRCHLLTLAKLVEHAARARRWTLFDAIEWRRFEALFEAPLG